MYHFVGDVDSVGSYALVWAGYVWKISVSYKFCCEPETALKKIKLKKRQYKKLHIFSKFSKDFY